MVMTASPAIAPLLGSIVATAVGWRGIFGLLAAAAAGLLLLTLVSLPETNRQRTPLPGARSLLAVYGQLLGRSDFRAYAIGGACMTTSIYAFLSASPFLFTEFLKRPSSEVGLYYMVVVAGITLGSWVASRLTIRWGIQRLLLTGASLGMAGAAALLTLDLLRLLNVQSLLATMLLFALGAGITSPVATARAISVDPRARDRLRPYGCFRMPARSYLAGLGTTRFMLPVAIILLASATTAHPPSFWPVTLTDLLELTWHRGEV